MYLTIKNKKIFYDMKGDGEAILWVHGWGGSHKSLWKLHAKASKSYKSIILDLPGFGRSDLPEKDWGIHEYAEIIELLIKELGIKRINYFGHSFGGALGIHLASENKSSIKKLIVCAPSYKRNYKKHWITKAPFYSLIKNRLQSHRRSIYRIFFRKSDSMIFENLEPNYRKIITQDLTENAARIKQPTLILWGDLDKAVPVEQGVLLHKLIKGSKIKIFQGYRHNLPLINSKGIFPEINKFLIRK